MQEGFETNGLISEAPSYPRQVRISGIIWIVFGSLILGWAGLSFFVLFMKSPGGVELYVISSCVLAMYLFGGGFLLAGVKSVRGTARDLLGYAVGSIIFALLCFGMVLAMTNGALSGAIFLVPALIIGGLHLLAGLLLLLAGILALDARRQYREWRSHQLNSSIPREAVLERGSPPNHFVQQSITAVEKRRPPAGSTEHE
jgi:hypothetical protein